MDIEMLKAGSIVMVIGMGTVFFFLSLMIVVMNVTTKVLGFIGKYFPEEVEEEKTKVKKTKQTNNDAEIALVVACAIQKGAKQC